MHYELDLNSTGIDYHFAPQIASAWREISGRRHGSRNERQRWRENGILTFRGIVHDMKPIVEPKATVPYPEEPGRLKGRELKER